MQQETFKKLNTCMAWLVFAIAAIVYGLTVEPTASLWDCPEFIACGYKLEIVSSLLRRSDEWLSWINTIKPSRRAGSLYNRYTWMQTMEQALVVAEQFERTEFIHQYIKQYERYNKQYQ